MASISSPGIGSGLDINGMVSQLVAVERKPLEALKKAASTIQTRISAYGQVQSLLSAVQDAADKLGSPATWQGSTATSSNATAVTATTTGVAVAGRYDLMVNALAQAQALRSPRFESASTLPGEGTLSLAVGQTVNGSFVPEAAGGASITVLATDTLQNVAEKINAAGIGFSASVVTGTVDGDPNPGSYLVIRANQPGSARQLQVSASGTGLEGFQFPATGTPATGMTQVQAGTDAEVNVNGITVRSAGNSVSGAVPGVTLDLVKTTTSAVTITVANDTSSQRKALDDFVKAYNSLNSYLAQQTRYDEGSKVAGTLQGDSGALSVRSQLRTALRESNATSSTLPDLRAAGFNVGLDGSLSLKESEVTAALSRPDELRKLFANADTPESGRKGLGRRIGDLARQLTGESGVLSGRAESLRSRLKRNETDQNRIEDRVEQTRMRLLRQYQALDTKMSQLSGLGSYVSQQMQALNRRSSD